MKCHTHKNKEALAKCSVCNKPFCEICLETLGDKYICFACLEKKVKKQIEKSRYTPYKALNISLLISIGAFTLIMLYILFLSLPIMPAAFKDLYSPQAQQFLFLIGKVILLILEISLIYISSLIAFWLGILIAIGLIVSPFLGLTPPEITNEILIFNFLLPTLAFFGLLFGKKGLENKN